VLERRVIVCLDVRDGRTTKGVRFVDNEDVGDPVAMARAYYEQGVDELVFYDITASAERRGIMLEVVRAVAAEVFIPFAVGGGIRSLEQMQAVLLAGAEKVSVNSPAVRTPQLIAEGAAAFGRQCIVLGMDAKRDPAMPSGYRVYIDGLRTATDLDVLEWGQRAVELGAGEVVLNAIDTDGTRAGYELTVTRMLADRLPVPVVASGGAGTVEHVADVLIDGHADAALVASIVHYGTCTVGDIKEHLAARGVPVRID
jgi:cyclase